MSPGAFDSRHIRHFPFYQSALDSLLLLLSSCFSSSLFPFHLGPKISGRYLLLVEECCNAPDSMRQVSASYSPSLPCHLLACCTLPCHHMHFISCRHVHRICIRVRLRHPSIFPVVCFPIRRSYLLRCTPVVFFRVRQTFSEWNEACQVALLYHPETTGQVSFHLEVVWYSNG